MKLYSVYQTAPLMALSIWNLRLALAIRNGLVTIALMVWIKL